MLLLSYGRIKAHISTSYTDHDTSICFSRIGAEWFVWKSFMNDRRWRKQLACETTLTKYNIMYRYDKFIDSRNINFDTNATFKVYFPLKTYDLLLWFA